MGKKEEKAVEFQPKIEFKDFISPVNKIILDAAKEGLPNVIKNKLQETGQLLHQLSSCLCEGRCPDSGVLNKLVKTINHLKKEFDKSIGHRAYSVFELNIHKVLFNILSQNREDIVISYPCLEALISISKGIPEILDEDVMLLIAFHLQHEFIAATMQQFLKWLYVLTVDNEENRQFAFEHVLQALLEILYDDTATSPVIEDVALLIRALVSYDENPGTLLKACDRIRTIGFEVLPNLVYLLHKFLGSTAVLRIILITIQRILIDRQLIDIFVESNSTCALLFVNHIFADHLVQTELIHEALKLYYILVDSENVLSLMDREILHIIKAVLRFYPRSENITVTTLELAAKILLKYPYCSKWYYEYYIPELILRAMDWHRENYIVQKQGSWLMRILIKDYRVAPLFRRLRAPTLLMRAAERHRGKVRYDVYAALRDLGYNIDLTQPIKERDQRMDVPV